LLFISYIVSAVDSSCHCHGLEDSRSNRHGDTVLAGTIVRCICGTFTGYWNAVDDSDAVFVVSWTMVTIVSDLDVTIQKRESEGFVLGAFENTIRWVEIVEYCLGHCEMRRLAPRPSWAR
jgi:hypothetical protein